MEGAALGFQSGSSCVAGLELMSFSSLSDLANAPVWFSVLCVLSISEAGTRLRWTDVEEDPPPTS